jgi:hypothetical protein
MKTDTNVSSDVLHAGIHAKLSAEEIAKALARHNRHHHSGAAAVASGKPQRAGRK